MNIFQDLQPGSFDLHMHTIASDGVYSPAELVQKSKQMGLKTIAITDHDTLAGVQEAKAMGQAIGVQVISGVEISTKYMGKNVHVLGYDIVQQEELHESLMVVRDDRKWRALKIIEKFGELGMPISLADVLGISQDGVIARPHIAKAIVKNGYVADVQTVFDEYLADGKPADVEKKVFSPLEAIQMIHLYGGQAVLAHPIDYGDDHMLRELLSFGFDGIEAWHRRHPAEDVSRFLHYAEEFGLFVTGGSDFHTDEHVLGEFIR